MRPLTQLYTIRALLGLVAGAISAAIAYYLPANATSTNTFDQIAPLFNSITTALLIYIISYYVLKAKFKDKLEKPSQVRTMGIGMFFFMWLTFLVLFYTIIQVIVGVA
jgi:zinc transporter ZupT